MKGERTKEDREHIDDQDVKRKELKELMPDETRAVEKVDRKGAKKSPGGPASDTDKKKRTK